MFISRLSSSQTGDQDAPATESPGRGAPPAEGRAPERNGGARDEDAADGGGCGSIGTAVRARERRHGLADAATLHPAEATRRSRRHHRRRRFRPGRWIVRGLLVLLLLLIVAVIGIQIALWTNLPRSIVLSQIEQQLGLRAEASSVSTGWFGHTTLSNIKLSLPLAQQAVLDAPAMKVEHTWLPWILLGRGVEIKGIELDRPRLAVWQEPGGRWNLSEVLELAGRTGGKKQGQETAKQATAAAPPKLPRLFIDDATVALQDNAGRSQTIEHLTVRGNPDGLLLYKYDVAVPDHVSLAGRLVPGGDWEHEVTAKVKNIQSWLAPWAPGAPPFAMEAEWRGQAGGTGASGRLRLDDLTVGTTTARGVLAVSDDNGVLAVQPESLVLTQRQAVNPDAANAVGKADAAGGKPAATRAARTGPAAKAATQPATNPATAPAAIVKATTGPSGGPNPSGAGGGTGAGGGAALSASASGGRLTFDGKKLAAEHLRVSALGGVLEVNGQYTLGVESGGLSAAWVDLALPAGSKQDGSLQATVGKRLDGGPDFRGTLVSRGAAGRRSWDGRFELTGGGTSWQDLRFQLTAPAFKYVGPRHTLVLDGLTADGRVQAEPAMAAGTVGTPQGPQTVLSVDSIRLPDPQRLTGTARYEFGSKLWWAQLGGAGWPLPQVNNEPLAFRLDVGGNNVIADVKDLTLRAAEVEVKVTGRYDSRLPEPVSLKLDIAHREDRPQFNLVQEARRDEQKRQEPPLVRGTLLGLVNVTGTLEPMGLAIHGELTADDLIIGRRKVGRIQAHLDGEANPDSANVRTSKLELLGGRWDVSAMYDFDEEKTVVTAGVMDLPLEEVGDAAGQDGLGGLLDGRWTLEIPGVTSNADQLHMNGWVSARNVHAPEFDADTLTGKVMFHNGRLFVGPVDARHGPNGRIQLVLASGAGDQRHWEITDLGITHWPVPASGNVGVIADGNAKRIAIDLPNAGSRNAQEQKLRIVSDIITLGADFQLNKQPAGRAEVVAQLGGRTIDVRQISGNPLGSRMWGQSVIDFDHPLLAAGEVTIADVQAGRAAEIIPFFTAVTGRYDFHVRWAPARSPLALEPLQVDVDVKTSQNALYANAVELGGARFRGFVNLDPRWGLVRAVLEDEKQPPMAEVAQPGSAAPCPMNRPAVPDLNTLHVAGGVLKVWGRVVRNEETSSGFGEGSTSLSTHVRLAARCLDLNQFVHIGSPNAAPMPGFVNFDTVLYGTTDVSPGALQQKQQQRQRQRQQQSQPIASAQPPATNPAQPPLLQRIILGLTGSGSAELEQADLANFGPIAFLYNAMHLGPQMNNPTGRGSVDFRIENNRMNITRFYYFNRGIEARGVGTLHDLKDIPESRIEASLVGTARPFKNIRLPFIADLDQLLQVIQLNATSEIVSGTLHNPIPQLILFRDLGKEMRELLVGDIQSETRGSAGQ